jgi:hypothetical protein
MDRYDETINQDGTCEGVKDDGARCRASVIRGSRYCFFHHPAKENERREAQQRGGRGNRATVFSADAPDVPLTSLKDIASLYGRVINLQLRGEVSPKEASSLGYNFSQLAKLLDASKTEERLAALENAQKTREPDAPLSDPFEDEDVVDGNE